MGSQNELTGRSITHDKRQKHLLNGLEFRQLKQKKKGQAEVTTYKLLPGQQLVDDAFSRPNGTALRVRHFSALSPGTPSPTPTTKKKTKTNSPTI
mmetsp:Transcript_20797/g.84676  ORF Transcript_20797/g.84676 Transcript_20797/m.84676 type:complete len:95 (-) Transcript_20797:18-302(-)